jgi:hypothetical protein
MSISGWTFSCLTSQLSMVYFKRKHSLQSVDEGTNIAWDGNGMDMVLMNLLQNYKVFVDPLKGDLKVSQGHALQDPKMGCSFKANKKVLNIS